MTANQDILFEEISNDQNQKLGKIILNRPKALNALSHDMFMRFRAQLEKWEKDDSIKAVLIRSNCEKAFCAGGDIRSIYENKSVGAKTLIKYFELEYDTNLYLHHYPKPYIAMINGITMGGGVGISLNGKYTIAADNLRWAMPETLIGFFPDVGASYYLSRLKNGFGPYLALTGNSINAQDAKNLKLVDAVVSQDQFDAIEKRLLNEDVDSVITSLSGVAIASSLNLPQINVHFEFASVEDIFLSLEKDQGEWAKAILKALTQRSPTSLRVALRQLQAAKHKTFDQVIQMDLKIAGQMLRNPDFYEGIRAAVIDKDRHPQWISPDYLLVLDDEVSAYFD